MSLKLMMHLVALFAPTSSGVIKSPLLLNLQATSYLHSTPGSSYSYSSSTVPRYSSKTGPDFNASLLRCSTSAFSCASQLSYCSYSTSKVRNLACAEEAYLGPQAQAHHYQLQVTDRQARFRGLLQTPGAINLLSTLSLFLSAA